MTRRGRRNRKPSYARRSWSPRCLPFGVSLRSSSSWPSTLWSAGSGASSFSLGGSSFTDRSRWSRRASPGNSGRPYLPSDWTSHVWRRWRALPGYCQATARAARSRGAGGRRACASRLPAFIRCRQAPLATAAGHRQGTRVPHGGRTTRSGPPRIGPGRRLGETRRASSATRRPKGVRRGCRLASADPFVVRARRARSHTYPSETNRGPHVGGRARPEQCRSRSLVFLPSRDVSSLEWLNQQLRNRALPACIRRSCGARPTEAGLRESCISSTGNPSSAHSSSRRSCVGHSHLLSFPCIDSRSSQ